MNAALQWIVKVTHAKQLRRREHISDICSEEINENVWKKYRLSKDQASGSG